MPWLTHCTPSSRQNRPQTGGTLTMAPSASPSGRDKMAIRSLLADDIESSTAHAAREDARGPLPPPARLESGTPNNSNSGNGVQPLDAKRHMLPLPAILCSDGHLGQHTAYTTAASSPSSDTSSADNMATVSARAPRPSYSEEQRFFIMYTRVVLNRPWHEIELRYAKLFGQEVVGLRSRGGLTSVYYRIRKRWGMAEVLKTAPETSTADKIAVIERQGFMTPDFLAKMDHFVSCPVPEEPPTWMGY